MEVMSFFPAPHSAFLAQRKTVPSLRQKARRIQRIYRALKENESRPLVDLKGFEPLPYRL